MHICHFVTDYKHLSVTDLTACAVLTALFTADKTVGAAILALLQRKSSTQIEMRLILYDGSLL